MFSGTWRSLARCHPARSTCITIKESAKVLATCESQEIHHGGISCRQDQGGQRSRDGAHLPTSQQACFSIPLPKLCMTLSRHTAFHHDRSPTLAQGEQGSACSGLVITGIHTSPTILSCVHRDCTPSPCTRLSLARTTTGAPPRDDPFSRS